MHVAFAFVVLLVSLTIGAAESAGQNQRAIHLRNERILTRVPPPQALAAQPAQGPTARLQIIQFQGPIQPAWRRSLRNAGVDLLTYVPDDAYIADIGNTPPGQIRQFPFVHWMGRYKPEHKIHNRLQPPTAGAKSSSAEPVDVRVLVAPRVGSAALAGVKAILSGPSAETHLAPGTILRGRLDTARLDELAASDEVLWIEAAPRMRLYDEEAAKIVGGDDGLRSTPTLTQQLGYDGRGVVVAVADTGLDSGDPSSMHPDIAGRVDALLHYGSLPNGADGHGHGTHVAGIIAGNAAVGETDQFGALYGLGVASGARLVSQRIFDNVGQYEAPESFETLTRDAVNAGASIGNNSWGDDTQGRYDTTAMEFDALVRDANSLTPGDQPYILEFSAGNAGPGSQTIGTPAVAKNVITSGASQNNRFDFFLYSEGQEAMADFSSRGPCEDGRIKPDVVAPGTWIASLRSVLADDYNSWAGISDYYMYQGGTSQSGPQVSGAAAVLVQYYRALHGGMTPSPALVKAALINSAVDMDDASGTGPSPNHAEGWGRVDLTRIVGSQRTTVLIDQSDLLVTGADYETTIVVEDVSEPLTITLAYTDVPGFPGAIPALVNDLDLEVYGPDGVFYRGNRFANGDSVPNPDTADRINNVEGIRLRFPQPGEYRVRVYAHHVAQDARVDTGPVDQDFALAISGLLLPAGESFIYMNRTAYTAPGQIRVGVIDRSRAGQPFVPADVFSDTEPAGEPLVLMAAGNRGVFTNTIPTGAGIPATDGQLQVTHGDTITATYFDASAAVLRTAFAEADLLPPVITNVDSTNRFSRAYLTWNTDEPATGRVEYGLNPALGLVAPAPVRTTDHAVTLENLLSGATYLYRVIATDLAGNSATNDNGGVLFSLVAPNPPPVLLVDAFYDDFLFDTPPLARYADPLNQIGVGFDVWDHLNDGSPSLSDLRSYSAVLWRVPEFNVTSYSTFTSDERDAIADYLDQGGGFFVASMDLTTRLDEAGAESFRVNVLRTLAYGQDASVPSVTGVGGDPISDGMTLGLDYTEDYFGWDISDTLTPAAEAAGIFTEDASGNMAGLRYPGPGIHAPGRVVFLGFPFETIPASGPAPNNRTDVLRRILQFLSPGVTGEAVVSTDRLAYSLPSVITLDLADIDLEGAGSVSVTASSTTEPAGKPIVLEETSRPGLFRGQIPLAHAALDPSANHLRAMPGDTLRFRFFDASMAGMVESSATVDVTPPVVTDTSHQAGYATATIRWETDEPCDTLVQYGESLPLPINRTQFRPALTYSHEITLPGLEPTRTYFYQVVSQDAAGNATVDNNGGSYYSVTTLTPLSAPFSDSFETGAANWTVSSEEYTESTWRLGVPDNGVETAAHSPVNAFGSVLQGGSHSLIDTYLYSPAIQLTGGNQLSLRFWQSRDLYDAGAFDLLMGGQVLLIEVGSNRETRLALYQDNTSGWEQETIDLTPHLGKVVYLVWHHQLFSFDSVPRGGWLLDDVEILVDSINAGAVSITNNLAQASFAVTGPTTRAGVGSWMLIPNAPAGEYTVSFNPVPYYITPPPQTNTLAEGAVLEFAAAYTFTDSNTNGISDAWEQEFLGEISPEYPGTDDTDGDGATDYAEFMAGTNPTNAASRLHIAITLQPNELMRLQWTTAPGRDYLLESATEFGGWQAENPWARANGSTMSTLRTRPAGPTLYRVQVRP